MFNSSPFSRMILSGAHRPSARITARNALALSLCLSIAAAAGRANPPKKVVLPENSLVRIQIKVNSSGVIVSDQYVATPKVSEYSEFTGVIINKSGSVITLVGDYWMQQTTQKPEVRLWTMDGTSWSADLIGIDQRISLAVLQSEELGNRAVTFSSEPEAERLNLVRFTTAGIQVGSPFVRNRSRREILPSQDVSVSGLDPRETSWKGSIAFDTKGHLVGVVMDSRAHGFSKKLVDVQLLPSELVEFSFAEILKRGGTIPAGWMGVYLEAMGSRTRVARVVPGSPAHRSGILPGDLILGIDDQRVSYPDLIRALRWKGVGGVGRMSVAREGTVRNLEITLAQLAVKRQFAWAVQVNPSGVSGQEPVQLYRTTLPLILDFGLVLSQIGEQLASKLKSPQPGGLLVTEVLNESPAQRVGFRAGDIVVQINGLPVLSIQDVQRCIESSEDNNLEFRFVRDGQIFVLKASHKP